MGRFSPQPDNIALFQHQQAPGSIQRRIEPVTGFVLWIHNFSLRCNPLFAHQPGIFDLESAQKQGTAIIQ